MRCAQARRPRDHAFRRAARVRHAVSWPCKSECMEFVWSGTVAVVARSWPPPNRACRRTISWSSSRARKWSAMPWSSGFSPPPGTPPPQLDLPRLPTWDPQKRGTAGGLPEATGGFLKQGGVAWGCLQLPGVASSREVWRGGPVRDRRATVMVTVTGRGPTAGRCGGIHTGPTLHDNMESARCALQ